MDEEESLATFLAITNAPEGVARHVLEAHGFDLDASVSFYLESGGVGFGAGHGDGVEVIEEVQASRPDPRPQSRPLPARAAPRSSPIVVRPIARPAGLRCRLARLRRRPARPGGLARRSRTTTSRWTTTAVCRY
jgi:hypothetical protein